MRRDFHGYYKPTIDEFDAIWNEAIIVVDASVLLNIYTYSSTTSEEILALLKEFGDRLWIPNQVALEYHENRCGIILKETKRYAEISKALEMVGVALRARKQHPYISVKLAKKFEEIEVEIKQELAVGESKHRDLMTSDSICEKITELFIGRVGSPMNDEELERIYKEGAGRYTKRIPPGFCDIKKPEPDRYGDLIVWYQLIDHAKTSKRPVIFVTDDLKEDWWAFAGDWRIGPRSELRSEFRTKTDCDIYIYSSEAFIETANERGKKLSESAAAEIETASKERQQEAIDVRTLEQLSCSHLEQFRKREEVLERLMRDPLEKIRNQEEALARLMRDPMEEFRKREEALERLMRDPLEKIRKQEEALERLMRDPMEEFRKREEALELLMRDPLEKIRKQEKALEVLTRGPSEEFRKLERRSRKSKGLHEKTESDHKPRSNKEQKGEDKD